MAKFFIYFPENEDEIVRTNEHLTKTFTEIVKSLKGKGDIFYDEQNIDSYLQKAQILGIHLANPKLQIELLLHKNSGISVNLKSVKQATCTYFVWNLDEFPKIKLASNLLSEVAERYFQFPTEKYLLLNLQNSIDTCRERILVFKDAKHISILPKEFAHIEFVEDNATLDIWQRTNNQQGFSLLDRNRFKRTSFIQQGKPVYEELSTGNFWYLDNLHKDEYEVFDSNKEHIGVSDMIGNLDISQKVNGRVF